MRNAAAWRASGALLVLAALAAHAFQPDKPPAATATPDRVKAALPELEKLARGALKKTGIPGLAIVVVHQDRVVYLKGFGTRQAGKDEPVSEDTVFQLASVSKPLTTTVLAALVGEGVIGWDDRVSDLDPDFRLSEAWVTRELTLRDLLCHRSGLPDHAGDLLEDLGYTGAEVRHRLRLARLSSFRTRFLYTNMGFTEAAVAAARRAGKSWEDLAAAKLFKPLGMKSASYRYKDFVAARDRALLHVPDEGKLAMKNKGKWVARYTRDADAQAPAGGASASVRDLAQWLRLLLAGGKFDGEQKIPGAVLAETHRPHVTTGFDPATGRAGFYGLGWNVSYDERGRVTWTHSGGFGLGARTEVALLPAERLGIAVLVNASPTGLPEALNRTFFDLVHEGKVSRDWFAGADRLYDRAMKAMYPGKDYTRPPQRPSPALPNAAYVGTYHSPYYGDASVVEKEGGLQLVLGPKKLSHALKHYDRDSFTYQPVGESAAGPTLATFTVGADRKASRFQVEHLTADGHGAFTRKAAAK
jgi:CubicO group peptidase (beta-lactamase class C family)